MSSNRFGRDEYMYYIDINRNGDIYAVDGNIRAKEKYLFTAKDSIILSPMEASYRPLFLSSSPRIARKAPRSREPFAPAPVNPLNPVIGKSPNLEVGNSPTGFLTSSGMEESTESSAPKRPWPCSTVPGPIIPLEKEDDLGEGNDDDCEVDDVPVVAEVLGFFFRPN